MSISLLAAFFGLIVGLPMAQCKPEYGGRIGAGGMRPEMQARMEAAYSVVERVNGAEQAAWSAKFYPRFAQLSPAERRAMNGLNVPSKEERKNAFKSGGSEPEAVPNTPIVIGADELPEEFDPRQKWPECAPVINTIRDQSNCGDCWAVAAASIFSDRICIQSKGKEQVQISAIDVASCAPLAGGQNGCNGSQTLSPAWQYFQKQGGVSGANYGAKGGCKPYPFPPSKEAAEEPYQAPTCQQKCTNAEYGTEYGQDKHYASTPIRLHAGEEEDPKRMEHLIMQEVLTNGPVEVGFTIFKDFYYYSSGVYHHVTGEKEGGHAVRLVGWGVDKGVKYWLVANSWGEEWGERGFFRIRRGTNEAGIETITDPFAGQPIGKKEEKEEEERKEGQ